MSSISNNLKETSHVLYSRGYLYDEFDYFDSLKKISELIHKTQIQAQELILCCRTKRLKSSSNLKELTALENKFKSLGLDVYIKANELQSEQ